MLHIALKRANHLYLHAGLVSLDRKGLDIVCGIVATPLVSCIVLYCRMPLRGPKRRETAVMTTGQCNRIHRRYDVDRIGSDRIDRRHRVWRAGSERNNEVSFIILDNIIVVSAGDLDDIERTQTIGKFDAREDGCFCVDVTRAA